jgi:amino acid adenylation domain-containing protein
MTQSSIVSAIENAIRSYARHDALATGDEVITYRQLGEYVDEFSAKLQTSAKPGEFVGIEATRSAVSIVAMIGAMVAGCPFVFIDPRDSRSQNASKVASLDIKVVARTADRSPIPVIAAASTLPWGATEEPRPRVIGADPGDDDRIAYAIHTSGSTGEPKCVLVRVDPLARVIQDHVRQLAVTTGSRTLQFARLTFDGCITEILWTLTAGACLVVLPEEQLRPGGTLGATLEDFRITHLKTTPFALTATEPTRGMSLQHVINGGGACRPAVVRKWSEVAAFHNAYGTTETTICNLLTGPLTPDECADGVPLGDLVGEGALHLEPLPTVPEDATGDRVTRGELVLTGGCVALGYLTATGVHRFLDGSGARVYRTGDVVEERNGRLFFLERVDRQLKVRGYRLDPGEIESAACRCPGVVEAVVTAESHDGSAQASADALVCYYLGDATVREVRGHLESVLDGYKVPSVIQQIDALPYTRNGKVDRDALRASRRAEPDNDAAVPVAEQILQLARHLTGTIDAGLEDNFFDIGGDSASTVILVTKLKELGWMDVGVRDVLRAENLQSLVLALSERSA